MAGGRPTESIDSQQYTTETLSAGGDDVIRCASSKDPPPKVAETDDGADEPAKPAHMIVTTVALTFGVCLVAFAAFVDNTILGTAIPRIAATFDSLQDAGLYRSASLVASTSLQLPFGKVYANFNVKWTYLGSIAVFEAGSVMCALAPDSRTFIVGRVVSGAGAAALYLGAINVLALAAPPQFLPALFGLVSGITGLASLAGPALGGIFTDSPRLTWRWCFWINLPIGAVAAAVILVFFRIPGPRRDMEARSKQSPGTVEDTKTEHKAGPATMTLRNKVRKMDPCGIALLIPAMTSVMLALQWGGTKYSWQDPRVLGCLVAFGLLTAAFVGSQFAAGDEATIPPRLLCERAVLGGVLLMAFLAAAMFTHVFFLPFYFQLVQGMSATASGLRTIAYVGSMALSGVLTGAAMGTSGRFQNHRPYAWVGSALFVVGAGLLHLLSLDSGIGMVVGVQILSGAALGIAWQVPFVAVQRSERLARSPGGCTIANALVAFSNSFGATLGVSIAQNIFAGTLARGLAAVPGIGSAQAEAIANGGEAVRLRDSGFLPADLVIPVLQVCNRAIMWTFTFALAAAGVGFLCSFVFP